MKLMSFFFLTNIYWSNSKMTPISYDYIMEYMTKWEHSLAWYDVAINSIITPPTSFSQSRHSVDVTWRHTLSPRCTQRQTSVTGIHWNAYYLLNKGWWRDKFVIRTVSDVLRVQSRFVKMCRGFGLRPHPPQILLTYFGPEVRQKQTL